MPISITGRCNKRSSPLILNFRRGGFTLIELIVVIFILLLFVGLIMPSFYGVSEGRLKSDAGKIASILRYLNDASISRKETFPLKIDIDLKTFRWNTPEGEKNERFGSLFDVSTTATGNISSGEATLFFSPLGLQENLVITLKENEKEMAVTFNPMSGRVKVIKNSK